MFTALVAKVAVDMGGHVRGLGHELCAKEATHPSVQASAECFQLQMHPRRAGIFLRASSQEGKDLSARSAPLHNAKDEDCVSTILAAGSVCRAAPPPSEKTPPCFTSPASSSSCSVENQLIVGGCCCLTQTEFPLTMANSAPFRISTRKRGSFRRDSSALRSRALPAKDWGNSVRCILVYLTISQIRLTSASSDTPKSLG